MKIVLLLLHIVSAISFAACAVISTNIVTEICCMIATVSWSMCTGMDICD